MRSPFFITFSLSRYIPSKSRLCRSCVFVFLYLPQQIVVVVVFCTSSCGRVTRTRVLSCERKRLLFEQHVDRLAHLRERERAADDLRRRHRSHRDANAARARALALASVRALVRIEAPLDEIAWVDRGARVVEHRDHAADRDREELVLRRACKTE